MYSMRSPFAITGSVVVNAVRYEITPGPGRAYGVVEVPDLHTANFLAEHCGYGHLGHEQVRRSKKLVIKRGRGLGDILMVVPLVRKLMEEDPEKEIVLACDEQNICILKHLPYFKKIVSSAQLAFNKDDVEVFNQDHTNSEKMDFWLNLEN